MDIFTKTNSGLEQRIHLFEPPFNEKEIHTTVEQPKDEEQMFQEHREKYADGIHRPEWRKVLLVLQGLNPKIDPRDLELLATSSYHIQAIRKGMSNDVTPTLTSGLILTDDNKFVYGIRGGKVEPGKVCIVPANSCTALPDHVLDQFKGRNILTANFYVGLTDELGVFPEQLSDVRVIGYHTDPDFSKTTGFVYYAKTEFSSAQLVEMHKRTFNVYERARKEHERSLSPEQAEIKAREAIRKQGLPNIDAWEHTALVFVDNQPSLINRIIADRKIPNVGVEHQLLDIGRAPLILYYQLNVMGLLPRI